MARERRVLYMPITLDDDDSEGLHWDAVLHTQQLLYLKGEKGAVVPAR